MATVLAIVDDQQMICDSLRIHFSMVFPALEVITFNSGKEILDDMDRGKKFDLVLMDGRLPDGYTGPSYTADILARNPQTIVIGISLSEWLQTKFLQNGAKYFLSKLVSINEIDQTIKEALNL